MYNINHAWLNDANKAKKHQEKNYNIIFRNTIAIYSDTNACVYITLLRTRLLDLIWNDVFWCTYLGYEFYCQYSSEDLNREHPLFFYWYLVFGTNLLHIFLLQPHI